MENINIALCILIGLQLMGLGVHIAKHGEPKDEDYNVFRQLFTTGIIWILYYYMLN